MYLGDLKNGEIGRLALFLSSINFCDLILLILIRACSIALELYTMCVHMHLFHIYLTYRLFMEYLTIA